MAAARARFAPKRSAKRRNGFDLSHLHQPDDVELWPENLQVWTLFDRVCTQWRVGMAGPVGLDYCAAYPIMERMSLSGRDWLDMLDDLRVMEQAAMAQISENASQT